MSREKTFQTAKTLRLECFFQRKKTTRNNQTQNADSAITAAEWELFELPESADLILGYAPGAGQAVSILPAPGLSGLLVEGVPIEQVSAETIDPSGWRNAAAFDLFPGDTLVLLTPEGNRFKLALFPSMATGGTAPVEVRFAPLEESAFQDATIPFYSALDLESGAIFTDKTIASVIFCQNIAIEPTPTPSPVPEPGSAGLLLLGLLGALVSWRLARRKGRSVWMLLLLLSLLVGVQGINLDDLIAQNRDCLLLIEHDGDGSGRVAGDGIDCGDACSISPLLEGVGGGFPASGEVYHVKATADAHSRFSHWLVNGAPYSGLVQMTGDTILTALFDATHPPAAVNDRYSTDEDVALQLPAPGILANDSDPDGDPLSAELVQSPLHGTLALNPDGSFTYTPNPDFHGVDQLLYRVSDGELQSAIAVVTIDVLPVSEAPIAGDLSAETVMNHPLEITLQGHDPDGDSLLYHLVDLPANGTLSGADNQVIYTPNSDFTGQDTFTYRVNDGEYDSNIATVTILVKHIDLAISSIDLSQTAFDPHTMSLSGTTTVTFENSGAEAVDGGYELHLFVKNQQQNNTIELGAVTITESLAPGASLTLEVPVNGALLFKDQPVYAFVDSDNAIAESDEENNITHHLVDCQTEPAAPGSFEPVLEWEWTGSEIFPTFDQVATTPVVANLNDDNGDGKIDTNDIPDILFGSVQFGYNGYLGKEIYGILRAISGDGQGELFSITDYFIVPYAPLSVGDIDNDGLVEIIAFETFSEPYTTARILAFEHDGTFKWASESFTYDHTFLYGYPAKFTLVGSTEIADLDRDNIPEIILGSVVLNNDGTTKWIGQYAKGGHLSIVADLDLDGDLEVIDGDTAYRANGEIFWHNDSLLNVSRVFGDSHGVANFDTDPYPEIVLVTSGYVYLLEHTGEVKWGPVDIPPTGVNGDNIGSPVIADVDGDGQPEIGVAGGYNYVVLESDGSIKWTVKTQDYSSSCTGSSVFDFDGDGSVEIVYADERKLHIYRGIDGEILFEYELGSITAIEYPVIVDVDNDNNAEIIAVSDNYWGGSKHGIHIFGDANDSWVNTRKIWNQHSYHITNVNDDGTIPQFEANSCEKHNTYRCNISADALACEDYSASYVRVDATDFPTSATIIARIGNAGIVNAAVPLNVAFYLGDPQNGGTLLGTTITKAPWLPASTRM